MTFELFNTPFCTAEVDPVPVTVDAVIVPFASTLSIVITKSLAGVAPPKLSPVTVIVSVGRKLVPVFVKFTVYSVSA